MAERMAGAIDLGGTKILSAVIGEFGRIAGEDRRPTLALEGAPTVIDRMVASLEAAAAAAGIPASGLAGVGVAAAGPIDAATGELSEAPNLPGWKDVLLSRVLGRRLGLSVLLENDANAAGLGEHVYGAGRGSRDMVYITVSTGIGGGLILDGKLYRGITGGAGEIGHMVLLHGGPLCGCGRRGCLEALASGSALAREGASAVAAGRSPALARIAASGEAVSSEHVSRAADEGDEAAAAILAQAAEYLGVGLMNVVHLFNPEVIVIGGGASKIGPRFLDPAIAYMRAHAFPTMVAPVRVLPAQKGDNAGVFGAAALVFQAGTV
ncbi:MAG: ROK family protein [Dehalococcoidia bacterium]